MGSAAYGMRQKLGSSSPDTIRICILAKSQAGRRGRCPVAGRYYKCNCVFLFELLSLHLIAETRTVRIVRLSLKDSNKRRLVNSNPKKGPDLRPDLRPFGDPKWIVADSRVRVPVGIVILVVGSGARNGVHFKHNYVFIFLGGTASFCCCF